MRSIPVLLISLAIGCADPAERRFKCAHSCLLPTITPGDSQPGVYTAWGEARGAVDAATAEAGLLRDVLKLSPPGAACCALCELEP